MAGLVFIRSDRRSSSRGWLVCYELDMPEWPGRIQISREGIELLPPFPKLTLASLEDFHRQMRRAVVQHEHLAEDHEAEAAPLTEQELDVMLARAEAGTEGATAGCTAVL